MVFDNIAPPLSDLTSLWNIFDFELSLAFGWSPLIGLVLVVLSAYFVLRLGKPGESGRNATILIMTAIPAIISMGYLPAWVYMIIVIIITLIGKWMYEQG